MLKKKQKEIIESWTDGYQFLFLLSFLAKIFLFNIIIPSKSFRVDLVAKALKLENDTLFRIFYGLETMGLCCVSGEKISLSGFAQSFLEDRSALLKVIIASDRWAPNWMGTTIPEKISNPVTKALNSLFKADDYINILLQEWFCLESKNHSKEIIAKINFKNVNSVADIGGGSGQIILAILKRYKKIRGTVFDKIYDLKNNQISNTNCKIEQRILRVGCDFFKKIKTHADFIFLKSVLHNWDDKHALKILKNVYISIPFNSKLFIIERIFNPKSSSETSQNIAMLDLRMFFLHSGRERSLKDFKELIELAGFILIRKTATKSGFYILEAIKAK